MVRKLILAVLVIVVSVTGFVFAQPATPSTRSSAQQAARDQKMAAMRAKMRAIQEKKKAMIEANGGKPLTKEQRKQLSDELRKP